MAGMWILLRNKDNRNILAKTFDTESPSVSGTETRIAEAIQVHEMTEEQQQRQESIVPDPDTSDEGTWGLESLVKVGEAWLTGLLETPTEQDGNASILKLFEFLTASLCLFIIPDDAMPDQGPQQIFEFDPHKHALFLGGCG